MNYMKEIKKSSIIAAVASIIAGLILLIFPTLTAKAIAYVVAAAFLVFSLVEIFLYFKSDPPAMHRGLIIGLLCLTASIFIFASVDTVISIIPVILGFIIVLSGFTTLSQTIDLVRLQAKGWVVMLVVACVNIVLGILCIANPFTAATTLMSLIGVGLIFSGISDLVAILYLSDRLK